MLDKSDLLLNRKNVKFIDLLEKYQTSNEVRTISTDIHIDIRIDICKDIPKDSSIGICRGIRTAISTNVRKSIRTLVCLRTCFDQKFIYGVWAKIHFLSNVSKSVF